MTLAELFCTLEPVKPDSVAGYTVRLRTALHAIENAWHLNGDAAALPAIRNLAEIAVAALIEHGCPAPEPMPDQGEQIATAATQVGTAEMRAAAVERLHAYRRTKALTDAVAMLAAAGFNITPQQLEKLT